MLARLSLRARLVLGVIVLGAAGLAAADVATYASLRSFLMDRMDESLAELDRSVGRELRHGCSGPRGGPPRGADSDDYVQLRTADGEVICSAHGGGFLEPEPPSSPDLPETIDARPGGPGAGEHALDEVNRILPGLGEPVPMRIDASSPAVGRTLAGLNLRGLTGATVLAILRSEGSILAPSATEVLREGDLLALAGTHGSVEAARALLRGAAP